MQTTKFYDLKPGDRFVDQDDRVCTKINGVTARLHLEDRRGLPTQLNDKTIKLLNENPSKDSDKLLAGHPYGFCLAAMSSGTVVRFIPATPAKFSPQGASHETTEQRSCF